MNAELMVFQCVCGRNVERQMLSPALILLSFYFVRGVYRLDVEIGGGFGCNAWCVLV